MHGNAKLWALALWLLTAPVAYGKLTPACGTLVAAAGLERAATQWQAALDAFTRTPDDERVRAAYTVYAPYQAMFQAYADFRSATADLSAVGRWPKGDRAAAVREGLVDELAAKVEETRVAFEAEWQSVARRFLDGPLGDPRPEAPPIRLAFSDKEVAAFFARCRNTDSSAAQSCAGNVSWSKYARTALRRLELVNASKSLDEIRTQTKDLKRYNGGARYAGYFAIEIDHQWRLLFHWDHETGTAVDVFIEDYHNE